MQWNAAVNAATDINAPSCFQLHVRKFRRRPLAPLAVFVVVAELALVTVRSALDVVVVLVSVVPATIVSDATTDPVITFPFSVHTV